MKRSRDCTCGGRKKNDRMMNRQHAIGAISNTPKYFHSAGPQPVLKEHEPPVERAKARKTLADDEEFRTVLNVNKGLISSGAPTSKSSDTTFSCPLPVVAAIDQPQLTLPLLEETWKTWPFSVKVAKRPSHILS